MNLRIACGYSRRVPRDYDCGVAPPYGKLLASFDILLQAAVSFQAVFESFVR
jgi:hypothetical protein